VAVEDDGSGGIFISPKNTESKFLTPKKLGVYEYYAYATQKIISSSVSLGGVIYLLLPPSYGVTFIQLGAVSNRARLCKFVFKFEGSAESTYMPKISARTAMPTQFPITERETVTVGSIYGIYPVLLHKFFPPPHPDWEEPDFIKKKREKLLAGE
jgi:hypothetical protein